MKRRRENRREEDYFVIKAGLDGHEASLALEIPNRLYNSFSCQFQSSNGVEKLNEFFFAYTDLSTEQREFSSLQSMMQKMSREISTTCFVC